MQSDCEYYLGNGGRHPKYLWADNEKDQIACMKALWESFGPDEKPEWLSMEQINAYEKAMVPNKDSLENKIREAESKTPVISQGQDKPVQR